MLDAFSGCLFWKCLPAQKPFGQLRVFGAGEFDVARVARYQQRMQAQRFDRGRCADNIDGQGESRDYV